MPLHLGGLMSAISGAAATVANLVGQTVTALKFISSQASGSDAFAVTTNGARWHVGAGASDYFSSDGTTIAFAGPITPNGGIAFGSAAAQTVSGSRINADLTISSAMDAATASATIPAITIKATAALGAQDLIVGVRDSGNAVVYGVNYTGATSQTSSDSSGTPGAAIINLGSGRSAIAAGASSVVITNSNVAATSRVFIQPLANDATGLLPIVSTTGAGSFTVTTTANCTAALSFNWWVQI